MNAVGVVVWNGDRNGPNRGHLLVEADDLRGTVDRRAGHRAFHDRVIDALMARSEGWLCHELAKHLGGVDSYRVNGTLQGLKKAGLVRAVKLSEPVWTGFRWAEFRWVWIGEGASTR